MEQKNETEAKCEKCGSTDIWKNGFLIQKEGKFQRYQCKACGFIFKGEKILTKRQKKRLGTSWRSVIK